MKSMKILGVVAVSLFLTACAQQEEPAPAPIAPEPVYDKYGNPV
jgi:nitrous oxide reductase accessory protein NosL